MFAAVVHSYSIIAAARLLVSLWGPRRAPCPWDFHECGADCAVHTWDISYGRLILCCNYFELGLPRSHSCSYNCECVPKRNAHTNTVQCLPLLVVKCRAYVATRPETHSILRMDCLSSVAQRLHGTSRVGIQPTANADLLQSRIRQPRAQQREPQHALKIFQLAKHA